LDAETVHDIIVQIGA